MAIEIRIGASFNDKDIKRAQRELANLAKVSERMSQSVAQRMEATGKSFEKFGKDLSKSVTAPLVGVAALSVKAFMDQEDAVARMEATLKATGGVAGVTSDHIKGLANNLQQTTTFADEATVGAGALLLTFKGISNQMGEGNDVFDRTIKASQDLSALMGTDLNSAVMTLGKALQDPATGLQRLTRIGIQFSDQQKEQIKTLAASGDALGAQKLMLAEVESQFGGTAEAMANTASGKIKQALNQLSEAGETFGAALAPAVEKVAGFISTLGGALASMPGPLATVIAGIGGLAAAFGPMVWVTGTMMTNLSKIMSVDWTGLFGRGVEAVKGFVSALSGGMSQAVALVRGMSTTSLVAFGAFGAAVVGAGIALKMLADKQARDARESMITLNSSVETLSASLQLLQSRGLLAGPLKDLPEVLRRIKEEADMKQAAASTNDAFGAFAKMANTISEFFSNVPEQANAARESLAEWDGALTAASTQSMPDAVAQFQALADAAEKLGYDLPLDRFPQLKAAIEVAAEEANLSVEDFMAMAGAGKEVGDKITEATQALKDWESAVKAQFDPLWGFQDSVQTLIDLKTEEAKKQKEVNDAVANFGPDSAEARTAMRELTQIQEDQIIAAGTQQARWIDLINGVKSGEVPLAKAIADIDELARQGLISADVAATQRQRFVELAEFLLAAEFPDVTIPVNSNAAEVLATLQELETFLRNEQTKIEQMGLTDWALGLGNSQNPFNPNSADGGPVAAGRIGWVGERGPELFVPNVDGTIIPHYQSRRIVDEMGRGGVATATPTTYNITINGLVGRDKQEILAFLARELPRAAATQARSYG
jgi:hypothetical protein